MNRRVLITGASGTIGKEVLRQLMAFENYDVTVFDMETEKSVKFYAEYQNRVNVVYGDLAKEEEVEVVTHGFDFVIHLAEVAPPLADSQPKRASEVNIRGTQRFIQLLEKNSPNAFFLYSSSVVVYGDRVVNPFIYTTDALEPSDYDYYASTKIKAETFLRNSSLDWSVFRLSTVMGYTRGLGNLMFEMPLETSLEIITPEDAARAFVNAIDKKDRLSKTVYNLGGGESCRTSYKDFLTAVFKIYGVGKLGFPKHAFAKQNYHGGFYADGDILEDILAFRRETLEDYYDKLKQDIHPVTRFITYLIQLNFKRYLLKFSIPYQAYKTNDKMLLDLFFHEKPSKLAMQF